jgi:enamine deaminase RidA (YjgF/YER057c/UK114 family)
VFERLATTLASAGSSMREVAFIRAFFTSDDHFPMFRDARRRAFEQHGVTEPPPVTAIIVKGLFGGSLIELDAVAVAGGET